MLTDVSWEKTKVTVSGLFFCYGFITVSLKLIWTVCKASWIIGGYYVSRKCLSCPPVSF